MTLNPDLNLTLHQPDNTHSDKTQMHTLGGVAFNPPVLKQGNVTQSSRAVNLNKDIKMQILNLFLYYLNTIRTTACCVCSLITFTEVIRKAVWIHGQTFD